MQLNYRAFGDEGDVLVIVHGLYGSMSNWNRLAKMFSSHFRVITPDLRNHGRSPWDDEHSYEAMSEDLAELIEQISPTKKAYIIGHSMGGKAAMMLAINHPKLVEKAIIADIAPVNYDKNEHIEIMSALASCQRQNLSSRQEYDAHLITQLKHNADDIAQKTVRSFLLQNLVKIGEGYDWRINLAALIAHEAEIRQWPEDKKTYDGPVLFLYGKNSSYVRTAQYSEIRRIFPMAEFEGIEHAGHWLHAEQPDAFYKTSIRFLIPSLLD